jgi:hypothetical protein
MKQSRAAQAKLNRIAAGVIALILCAQPAGALGCDFARSFGIAVRGGMARSLNGGWDAARGMRGATKVGPDFEIAVEKWVGGHYRCEAAAMLAWMDFNKGAFPIAASGPSFTAGALVFGNCYHFTEARVRPFVAAGAGIYFWKMNMDRPLGGILRTEGTRFQKMSYGLNAGAGLEWVASPLFSIVLDARYHYILAEDRFLFGDSFTEQGVLTLGAGVSYSFSSRGEPRKAGR